MITIPKIFTPTKKNKNNGLTNQAQFIDHEDDGIPPRAATATKVLEEQALQTNKNNEDLPTTPTANRESIIAKSKQIVEHNTMETKLQEAPKVYSSPLNATSFEQPNLESINPSSLPLIQVDNDGEDVMDIEIMNREHITYDEKLYKPSNIHHRNDYSALNESEGHSLNVFPPKSDFGNGDNLDTEDAEIAAIIAQLEDDPYTDANKFGEAIVVKQTLVNVVYDNVESIKSVTYQFGIPFSQFLDIYEMEVASQGYFCSVDVNGTHVTLNPNKCYTIEIFE